MARNHPDRTPKEEVIRAFARHLELDADEFIFLAGRIPSLDRELLQQHYKTMPALFRRIREGNPIDADCPATNDN